MLHAPSQDSPQSNTLSQDTFFQLLNLLPNPVFYLHGPGLTIEFANETFLKSWGYLREDVLHRSYLDLIPNQGNRLITTAQQAYTTGEVLTCQEVPMSPPDNLAANKVFEFVVKPVHAKSGLIEGVLCTGYDISAEVEARKEVAQTQTRFGNLFHNSPVSNWEEDYTAVKEAVDSLLQQGIQDFDRYFTQHPEHLQALVQKVVIKDVNKATLDLHGGTKEELLAGLEQFFVTDTLPAFLDQLKTIAAGGGRYESKSVVRTQKGSLVSVQVFINFPTSGDYSSVPVTLIDITAEKKAEIALRESENRMRVFVENAPAAIALFDKDMCYLAASKHWVQDYNLPNDFLGQHHYLIFPNLPAHYIEAHQNALAGHAYFVDEDQYDHADGTVQWIKWEVQPWYNNTGEVGGIIVATEDITKRKQAETALQESESRLKLFVENAPAAIALLDTNLCYMVASRRWKQHYNLQGDITGKSHYDIFPELPEYWKAIDRSALAGNIEKSDEDKVVRTDGTVQYLKWEVRPWYKGVDQVGGIIIATEDITEAKKSEAALRESDLRFYKLADSAPVIVWVTDKDGYCQYLNNQWYEFTGQSTENGLGVGWQNAIHPGDKDSLLQTFTEASASGASYTVEYRLLKRDGTYEWVHVVAEPRFNEDGVLANYTGSLVNIHARKLAEEALQRLNLHLELSTDAAEVGTWTLHFETGKLEWSAQHKKMWGYDESSNNLNPADWARVLFPEDQKQAKYKADIMQFNSTRYSDVYRIRRHNDGAIRWIQSFGQNFYNENGEVTSASGISIDITEQKEREEALRQSEERYRDLATTLERKVQERTQELQQAEAFMQSVLESTHNGILTYLPLQNNEGEVTDLRIQYINDAMARLFELAPSAIMGKTAREAFPEAMKAGAIAKMLELIQAGPGTQYQFSRVIGGKQQYFNAVVSAMGEGATITLMNITAEKENAEQLKKINKDLQRSNADLQQFAHVASHDLKEPLRKIRTFYNRIIHGHEQELSQQVLQYLSRMNSATVRMNSMIEGVLLNAKMEAEEVLPEEVNTYELLVGIETDLELLIQQKHAVIQKGNLPGIKGTPVLMHQLFYNLLNNALKFARKDVPPVISIAGNTLPNGFVEIMVVDNGIGFDQEHADKIFNTFTRLVSKDSYEGSGLGLSLCRRIAERHGGSIRAEAIKGEGARFIVVLPG